MHVQGCRLLLYVRHLPGQCPAARPAQAQPAADRLSLSGGRRRLLGPCCLEDDTQETSAPPAAQAPPPTSEASETVTWRSGTVRKSLSISGTKPTAASSSSATSRPKKWQLCHSAIRFHTAVKIDETGRRNC